MYKALFCKLKICKASANGSSNNIKFLKLQFSEMIQSGRFNIFDLMHPAEVVYKIVNKVKDLSKKVSLDDAIKASDISRNF